jgi:RES domain
MVGSRAGGTAATNTGPQTAPGPTAALARIALPIIEISAAMRLYRVHRDGYDPVYFTPRKPPIHRFDDPHGVFGTLYLGEMLETGFLETLLRNPRLRLVAWAEIDTRRWSMLTGLRTLRLVDFTGPGLSVVGTDGGVNTGPYLISQAWARALFDHADAPDGVLYPSRHDPSLRCAALFSRPDLDFDVGAPRLFNRSWVSETLKRYGKAVAS